MFVFVKINQNVQARANLSVREDQDFQSPKISPISISIARYPHIHRDYSQHRRRHCFDLGRLVPCTPTRDEVCESTDLDSHSSSYLGQISSSSKLLGPRSVLCAKSCTSSCTLLSGLPY